MAFLDSSSSVVDAILTRKGRELLSKNDGSFIITKFAFGDDEINYQLYNALNPSDPDRDILNLPILEPISNENFAQRYRLITLPKGSKRIAVLIVSPSNITITLGQRAVFRVSTENGEDASGYSAHSRNTSIVGLERARSINSGGVGQFTIMTGDLAGGETGVTIIDIVGLETGARNTLEVTVKE